MSLDLTLLGSKIAAHRMELSDSLEDVAAATGVDSKRIAEIEAGKALPTGDEILILSDHFRCDYKIFLSNDPTPNAPPTQILYRAKNDDFSKEDRRAIRDFLYLCETEYELTQELGRITARFAFTPNGLPKAQAENAALAVRAHLGYQDREIARDVYGDCRKLGVHVFRRRLGDSNISGLFIVHPTAGKCILVNASEDVYRQRFSAAHELAHALFDSDAVARVSLRSERQDPLERRANEFASAYLMPPALLRQLPDPANWSDDDVKRRANDFRVSCDALGIALNKARLVSYAQSNHIRGLRVSHTDKVDPEIPLSLTDSQRRRKSALLEQGLSEHYVSLCFDAHHEGLISAGRLAEALVPWSNLPGHLNRWKIHHLRS
ncbi:XRE family transcriptional regulator [Pseudoduganella aquatica]|uniref:ImmA/IrrE family metallo-endopeptidase n=1 Tax=Pseudoduganella aquatica TaxID=2660641 RepID=A0A7X4KRC0_9BURK|nr:XRE family transcriptional regulator [Pseudoduganella aquatica]MYN11231.1 ImmA/IrrE family metallo-endopeptidase [Pseudoduganella aquatica]